MLKDKYTDKKERDILFSQIISFFLLAVLIFSYIGFENSDNIVTGYFITTVVFVILIPLIPLISVLNNKHNAKYIEVIINVIYFIIASVFLLYNIDTTTKIVLIMPIITAAIRFGISFAIKMSFCSIAVLIFISYKNNFMTIDSDLMYIIIFLLVAWLLGSMTETQNKIHSKLERLASNDGLTDIYNHRTFQSIMDKELVLAEDNKTSLILLMIDIDYFKVYNDSFGHQKGDSVLIKIGQILTNITSQGGYCARYGGEEFAVVFPDMSIDKGMLLGENIRNEIEKTEFYGMKLLPKGKLTVSIGIAEFPKMACNKEKLIQKADEALYKAKFVSKNKVVTYFSVFDELNLYLKEEEKEIFDSIRTLTIIINAKDKYTYGHSERVMQMAEKLCKRMNMDEQSIKIISYGALLHDIGKIEIAREILNKPTALNNKEWEILKQHPEWGAEIISPLKSLDGLIEIVLYHHENYDGSGYPHGIKGLDIPLGARILRIIDSYDAMTSIRPYKEALSMEQAIEELKRFSGLHYDELLLEEFVKMQLELEN